MNKTAAKSANHLARSIVKYYCARRISLAARNGLLKGGSLNGVVCARVIRHRFANNQNDIYA